MADVLDLSRRERQIMEVVYRSGRATAGEVLEGLSDPPSYSAVRALLKILEGKGHIRHVVEDGRYVWLPTVPRDRARRSALQNLLQTFFEGSAEKAVAALLTQSKSRLNDEELARLAHLIADAREEGR